MPNSGVTPMPVRPGSSVRISRAVLATQLGRVRPPLALRRHGLPLVLADRARRRRRRRVGVLHAAAHADPGGHGVTPGSVARQGTAARAGACPRTSAGRLPAAAAAGSVWSVAQHPTAAESLIVEPSTTNGSAAAIRSRSAMETACCGSVSSHRTANSSPPSRAATSPARSSATIRCCELGEHRVARGVPEPVVHRLEPVEVEVEQVPGPDVAAAPGQDLAHPLGEQRPVRQAGERIVQRPVVELGLQPLAVADVLDVHDQVRGSVRGPRHPGRADRHPDDPLVGQHEPALVAQDPRVRRPA